MPPPGTTCTRMLAAAGLLGPDLVAAHCVVVDDEELELLASHDVSVAHCPRSNAQLGCGIAPLRDFLDRGITVGLGTDSPASTPSFDMFEELRTANFAARSRERRPDALTCTRPSSWPRSARRAPLAWTGRSDRWSRASVPTSPSSTSEARRSSPGGTQRRAGARRHSQPSRRDGRRREGTLRTRSIRMARAAAKRNKRPRQAARPQPVAGSASRSRDKALEDQLFFGRLRSHAKWAFVFLAVIFAGGFVFLGVGTGSGSGLGDVFSNIFTGGGGPRSTSCRTRWPRIRRTPQPCSRSGRPSTASSGPTRRSSRTSAISGFARRTSRPCSSSGSSTR